MLRREGATRGQCRPSWSLSFTWTKSLGRRRKECSHQGRPLFFFLSPPRLPPPRGVIALGGWRWRCVQTVSGRQNEEPSRGASRAADPGALGRPPSPSPRPFSAAPRPPLPPFPAMRGSQSLCFRHFSRPCGYRPVWNLVLEGRAEVPATPPPGRRLRLFLEPQADGPGGRCRGPSDLLCKDAGQRGSARHIFVAPAPPGGAGITGNGAATEAAGARSDHKGAREDTEGAGIGRTKLYFSIGHGDRASMAVL